MQPMRFFKTWSIKRKLIAIMMTSSCAAMVLMALLLIINQAINNQKTTQQQLIAVADALGSTSSGALTFDDSSAGAEILSALAQQGDVIYAVIERSDGAVFAQFGRNINQQPLPQAGSPLIRKYLAPVWADLWMNEIRVTRAIYLEDERIGTIRIIATLDALYREVLKFIVLVAAVAGICFAVTLLICSRLQKIISDPIVNLQAAVKSVSEHNDYSLRVEQSDADEFGTLVEGFNQMLLKIQRRDTQLAKYSNHLEDIVAERTFQLSDANNKRIMWLETMACFLKHELKNATVGIKTSLDLIERRALKQQPIDVYLSRARISMTIMNALLQSAGDASNLEAIMYKEPLAPLDLAGLVMLHMESYLLIYPGTVMTVACQSNPTILGNTIRLKQLLDKLINNAVEHTDPAYPIEVFINQAHGKARLLVKNRGDALPKNKECMFDLFVSLRPIERKTDDNCGLGLYIVKLIAECHGGQVTAYDLDGGNTGAVFEVTFPLDQR